jgi:hypothetical protein
VVLSKAEEAVVKLLELWVKKAKEGEVVGIRDHPRLAMESAEGLA